MPITIIPGPQSTLGPGFLITVSTTTVPTDPANAQWWVYIQRQDESEQYLACIQTWSPTADKRIVIGYSDVDDSIYLNPIEPWNLHESAQRLLVQLKQGTEIIDSASQAITLDNVQGAPVLLKAQIERSAQGQGLTSEQALQLEETHEATIVKMAAPGVDIQWPIDVLSPHPGLDLLKLQPAPLLLSGDGQIFLPGQPGLIAFGAWWECSLVPPEVGLVRGLTERFQVRILQLNVLHSVDGIDLVTEVLDADFQRVLWEWQKPLPFALAYSVTPGFEILFHLLTTKV